MAWRVHLCAYRLHTYPIMLRFKISLTVQVYAWAEMGGTYVLLAWIIIVTTDGMMPTQRQGAISQSVYKFIAWIMLLLFEK